MDQFFTWEALATLAGCAAATGVVTQLLKDALKKIPTQLLSYIIALVILAAATAATGSAADWTGWAILPLNAVIVSLSANGGFEAIRRASKK
ncbi:MAG TPA: hypothetical protein IAB66_03315 [Candidatus Caccousia avistercoris]|nr:hypothetical protein [Candidatus Caccousia avistercoris]